MTYHEQIDAIMRQLAISYDIAAKNVRAALEHLNHLETHQPHKPLKKLGAARE